MLEHPDCDIDVSAASSLKEIKLPSGAHSSAARAQAQQLVKQKLDASCMTFAHAIRGSLQVWYAVLVKHA